MSKRSRADAGAEGTASPKRVADAVKSKDCYLLDTGIEDVRNVIWGLLPGHGVRIRVGRTCKALHQEIAKVTAKATAQLNWNPGILQVHCAPHLSMEPFINALVAAVDRLPLVISWRVRSIHSRPG